MQFFAFPFHLASRDPANISICAAILRPPPKLTLLNVLKNSLNSDMEAEKLSAMLKRAFQVNFWVAPENFGVWRFKLAMWKVDGIKIESAAGRQKNSACGHATSRKTEVFYSLASNSETKRDIMKGHKGWKARYA